LSALRLRLATAADVDAIAHLHADSWRRHYRGAYADEFLDCDVVADRLAAWRARLGEADPRRLTFLAEDRERALGFASACLDDDPAWGSLLDNLHVAAERQRRGIGARLLERTAEAVAGQRAPARRGLYAWVLEQNTGAQAFYRALGAQPAGRERVSPPGGVPGRLAGTPFKLRYAWADAARLSRRRSAS
jgi:GNAT superfamily N-acetyltransferase